MSEEQFVELDADANPYRPGSGEWHRFNLGIPKNVIGFVDHVNVIPGQGIVVEGQFFGEIPKSLADWWLDSSTMEAKLTNHFGLIETPAIEPSTWVKRGRYFRGSGVERAQARADSED